MPDRPRRWPWRASRRRLLRAFGGALSLSLAGCTTSDRSPTATTAPDSRTDTPGDRSTASPTTTTTATETDTETATDSPTPEPVAALGWRTDELAGRVGRLWLPNVTPGPEPAGGPLYAATSTGSIARVAVDDGTVHWEFTVNGREEFHGQPTLFATDSALYVVSDTVDQHPLRNYIEKLDPETGERRWVYGTRDFLEPLGVVDGTLYLAGQYIRKPVSELGTSEDPTGDGHLIAVDAATGVEQWRRTIPLLQGASVGTHGLYVLEEEGETESGWSNVTTLYAFELDGTPRFQVNTGTPGPYSPGVLDDVVLASHEWTDLGAYDVETGELQWTVGRWDRGPNEFHITDDAVYVESSPAVALTHAGDELWRVEEGGDVVAVTDDSVYLEGGREVQAINRPARERRWLYDPTDYQYIQARAVVDAGLFVDQGIRADNHLTLLSTADGAVAGTLTTPGNAWSSVGMDDRLFVGTDGTLLAYDVTVE